MLGTVLPLPGPALYHCSRSNCGHFYCHCLYCFLTSFGSIAPLLSCIIFICLHHSLQVTCHPGFSRETVPGGRERGCAQGKKVRTTEIEFREEVYVVVGGSAKLVEQAGTLGRKLCSVLIRTPAS